MFTCSFLSGCGDRFETIEPSGLPAAKSVVAKPILPNVSIDKTNLLYKLAINKMPGDKAGLIEMRSEGILIHPGENLPSKVSFKLSRTYQTLSVKSFISSLPVEATEIKEAGTVGVEFLLDGKSEGRFIVHRDAPFIKNIELTNIDILTIVVDNHDGKPWFDWLMLGVVG
jgi:hypothetical protein